MNVSTPNQNFVQLEISDLEDKAALGSLLVKLSTISANEQELNELRNLTVNSEQVIKSITRLAASSMSDLNLVSIKLHDASYQNTLAIYNHLYTIQNIEYITPNWYLEPQNSPNDPKFDEQWNLQAIKAEKAWDITTGAQNSSGSLYAAVIDTGVKADHEDLQGNLIGGFMVKDEQIIRNQGVFDSLCNDSVKTHGTAMSGIIGAVGNNNRGIAGLNWVTKIYNINIANSSQETPGCQPSMENAIIALDYLNALGDSAPFVVNYSIGVDCEIEKSDCIKIYQPLNSAIQKFTHPQNDEMKRLFVTVAGNLGYDVDNDPHHLSYPCSFTNPAIICVTSTRIHEANGREIFDVGNANYGQVSVDLAAPGNNIPLTFFLIWIRL